MKGSNGWTDCAGQEAWKPSGKKIGQKEADFQAGRMMTPLVKGDEEIFFQEAMTFPIGGQTKRHLPNQVTEKASVAKDRGYAKREKNRSQRALEGEAKGSSEKPEGRKRACKTQKDASSTPQSSLSNDRDLTSAA